MLPNSKNDFGLISSVVRFWNLISNSGPNFIEQLCLGTKVAKHKILLNRIGYLYKPKYHITCTVCDLYSADFCSAEILLAIFSA